MDNQEMFEDQSLWRCWAIAIVAADKPFGIDVISATVFERMPDIQGPISGGQETFRGAAPSVFGSAGIQEVTGGNTYQATWAPNGMDHLITSPMVRAGETVKLYKYADKQELYWTTLYREPGLRRIERFILAASNLSGGREVADMDSSYILDFNTLDKSITIQTSVSDGERYRYRVFIAPSEDRVVIEDNVGNKMELSSEDNNVYMEDASGGRVETRDGHPRIYGPKGILAETPEQFRVVAGNNLIEGPTVFTDSVDMKSTLSVAGAYSLGYGGSGGSGNAGTFGGNVQLQGGMQIDQGLTVDGYANFPGGHGPH